MYGYEYTLENMGVIEREPTKSIIGISEPIAHPKNCKTECSYGRDKAFCFPCMAKILNEHRAMTRKVQPTELTS